MWYDLCFFKIILAIVRVKDYKDWGKGEAGRLLKRLPIGLDEASSDGLELGEDGNSKMRGRMIQNVFSSQSWQGFLIDWM